VRDFRGRLPRPLVLLLALLLVGFIGATDFLTGFELSFSIFYLIPISLATLAGGRLEGLASAGLSTAAWLTADLLSGHSYSHWLIPYWNSAVRLGYFLLHTLLLDRLLTAMRRQEELSTLDPLTGAANWRQLQERAGLELEKAKRSRKPLIFCYLDLDNFKSINDTLGHEVGDDLLRIVVEAIQRQIRAGDLVARVGGDEFAVLLPETGYRPAHAVLERMQARIIALMRRNGWPVTLSMGAISFSALPSTVDSMVKRADDLMYKVKGGGKNDLRHESWPPGRKDLLGEGGSAEKEAL